MDVDYSTQVTKIKDKNYDWHELSQKPSKVMHLKENGALQNCYCHNYHNDIDVSLKRL